MIKFKLIGVPCAIYKQPGSKFELGRANTTLRCGAFRIDIDIELACVDIDIDIYCVNFTQKKSLCGSRSSRPPSGFSRAARA